MPQGSGLGTFVGGSGLGGLGASVGRSITRPVGAPSAASAPPDTLPDLRAGYVRIITTDAPWASVDVLTTSEPTLPLPAETGWDRINRPHRVDPNTWRSGKPLRFQVPFSMDVLAGGGDVEDEWSALMRIYRPANGVTPRTVKVTGPVTRPDLSWVIVELSEDESATKRRGNKLVRIEATLTFEQRVIAGVAVDDDPDDGKGKVLVDRPRYVTAKANDTLRQIAKRELDDGRKWKDIAAMYPGSGAPAWTAGPDKPIPSGTKVRLPDA